MQKHRNMLRLSMHIEAGPRRKHSINLTPLIDVVFILLVFFMLASNLTDWGGIKIATGTATALPNQAPAAVIGVTADGDFRYRGRVYDRVEPVASQLRARLNAGAVSAVVVQPEDGVRLGPTVAAFDALSGAGIEALALGQN